MKLKLENSNGYLRPWHDRIIVFDIYAGHLEEEQKGHAEPSGYA